MLTLRVLHRFCRLHLLHSLSLHIGPCPLFSASVFARLLCSSRTVGGDVCLLTSSLFFPPHFSGVDEWPLRAVPSVEQLLNDAGCVLVDLDDGRFVSSVLPLLVTRQE
jgi:hypothetical protein